MFTYIFIPFHRVRAYFKYIFTVKQVGSADYYYVSIFQARLDFNTIIAFQTNLHHFVFEPIALNL